MVSESNSRFLMPRLLLATLLLGACAGSDEGRTAPADSFFFPTGVVISPDSRFAFVTNGNTDLRFNGGTVAVVDLHEAIGRYMKDPNKCGFGTDPIDNRIAVCDEKNPVNNKTIILGDKTVRVGNFPGQPAVQQFLKPTGTATQRGTLASCDPALGDPNCIPGYQPDPSQGYRLLLPVRGDPSLTWINVDPNGTLDCGQSAGPVGQCDGAHRITQLLIDSSIVFAPEPFGVSVSNEMGVALTSHLASATVSLFDIGDRSTTPPHFVDVINGVFDVNQNGSQAAYGVALRPLDPALVPATCPGLPNCTLGDYEIFFATSRVSPRLAQLVARGADLCRPELPGCGTCTNPDPSMCPPCDVCNGQREMAVVESTQVRLDLYLSDGSDVRDVKFTKDGNRAYVVDRSPPTVVEIDTTSVPPPAGDPRDVILRAIEVCPQPSLLAVREDPPPLRVYVTCFAAGQIFVIDPPRGEVIDVINVGRGPNAVELLPTHDGPLGQIAVVANFADNDLAVVDMNPGSATENTVLFKIGMPNPVMNQ
jgi:DNA-binding beta-propeller fold protein YncE